MFRLNDAFAKNPELFWCPDKNRMEWLLSFIAYKLDSWNQT